MAFQRYSARTGSNAVRHASDSTAIELLEHRQLFALTVTPVAAGSATALTNALLQSTGGVTVTSSAYVGGSNQGGTFANFNSTSGSTNLTIPNGIVLTSGIAAGANGGAATATPSAASDADLTALINAGTTSTVATHDANSLTLTFTVPAGAKSVAFDFVFGSDEFPTYVGQFNDPFGVFLDGKQISFDANNKPITVNNNFFTLNNSGNTTDSDTVGKTVVTFADVGYNGLTPKITTTAPLNTALTTHTIKFAIADAGDSSVDSGVFISGFRTDASTGTGPITGQAPTAKANGPYTVPLGGTVKLNGTGTDPDQASASLIYSWDLDGDGIFGETGAGAIYGNETGATPTFTGAVSLLGVGAVQPVTLKVTDSTGLSATSSSTVTVTQPPQQTKVVANAGGPYVINEGSPLTLDGSKSTGAAGVTNSFSWDLNGDGKADVTGVKPTVSYAQLVSLGLGDGPVTKTITLTVVGGTPESGTDAATTTVTVNNVAPTANAGPDKTLAAPGTAVTLNGTFTDPGTPDTQTTGYVIKNASNVVVASGTTSSITFTPTASGTYTATFTVTDDDGGVGTDTALITVGQITPPPPTGPTVTSYTLVDAATKKDIETLTEGTILNLAKLPKKLAIRANTSLAGPGKVLFGYDVVSGQFVANYHLELGALFALFGDFPGGNYFGNVLNLGADTLAGTASTYGNSTGATKTIHFTVINDASTTVGSVSSFTIVDAPNKKDLLTLVDGATISLKSLGTTKLNVRANITGGAAASVLFDYDGKTNIEEASPYALFGDFPVGSYYSGTLSIGKHTLKATSYGGAGATGAVGVTKTITFTVTA